MLGIGLVGGSVVEGVMDSRLRDRLVRKPKMMGITEIPNFDVLGIAMKKTQGQGSKGASMGILETRKGRQNG